MTDSAESDTADTVPATAAAANWTPSAIQAVIMHARCKEWDEVHAALTAGGFPINAQDKAWCTVLHEACGSPSHLPTIRLALRLGANPDCRNILGETPLTIAAHRGSLEALEALVDAGAEVSVAPTGEERLVHAAILGHLPDSEARLRILLGSMSEGMAQDLKVHDLFTSPRGPGVIHMRVDHCSAVQMWARRFGVPVHVREMVDEEVQRRVDQTARWSPMRIAWITATIRGTHVKHNVSRSTSPTLEDGPGTRPPAEPGVYYPWEDVGGVLASSDSGDHVSSKRARTEVLPAPLGTTLDAPSTAGPKKFY